MPSASSDADDSSTLTAIRSSKWDRLSNHNSETPKSFLIDDQDVISPLMLGKNKEVDEFDLDNPPRSYSPRLVRKSSTKVLNNPFSSTSSHGHRRSIVDSKKETNNHDSDSSMLRDARSNLSRSGHHTHGVDKILDEVVAWLQAEKAKAKARKKEKKFERRSKNKSKGLHSDVASQSTTPTRSRRSSDVSEDALDLQELESILEKNLGPISTNASSRRTSSLNLRRYGSRSSQQPRRRMSMYKSSDTEFNDDDFLVPSCDVFLDNSKTLMTLNAPAPDPPNSSTRSLDSSQIEAWASFKYEIVRLTHTLKLKGWRQISLDSSSEVSVERLSGALTNAVYVVSAPKDLVCRKGEESKSARRRKCPSKLLLRIYGPNVEHLIDREVELRILKRLARKQIGPRLLGTFKNGRFEEYLNARPLKPQEMRDPETSKQIAKRMRELHDGIELLAEERFGGPFVWRNWEKWLDKAEETASQLDTSSFRRRSSITSAVASCWGEHGFICGTPWSFFRKTVELYRQKLNSMYGSKLKLREQLVFAHNDTQYGNILRLEPPGESPLLLPANRHKQLVVIDFEYSNANVPGYEFANHFTEWCYNYHDATYPFVCNTNHYPTPEEQRRFIKAYVLHQPEHTPAAPSTPRFTPMHSNPSMSSLSSLSSLSSMTLDGRISRTNSSRDQLAMSAQQAEENSEIETERLMHETRIWRIANSAQWVVWGILQAGPQGDSELENTTEVDAGDVAEHKPVNGCAEDEVLEEQVFDYLAYARERAMFFWGDCLQVGLVTEEDLGEGLMKELKIVKY